MATTLLPSAHSLNALFEYLYLGPDSMIPVWSTGGGLADQELVTDPRKHLTLELSRCLFAPYTPAVFEGSGHLLD